jgi:hypothetical protein
LRKNSSSVKKSNATFSRIVAKALSSSMLSWVRIIKGTSFQPLCAVMADLAAL